MHKTPRNIPDFATLAGVLIAAASVVGGLLLEGGSIRDIAQVTAALMVVGGTLGAVLISTPSNIFVSAFRRLRLVAFDQPATLDPILNQIFHLSAKARKSGLASLEADALAITDPFLSKALGLAADNTPLEELRSIMEIDITLEENRLHAEAKVFEAAGGYAPTVGIIGAVLGLIQVMKHLENIDEVGRGIAVSFVATVYGVALANLFLLPAAAKLKARADRVIECRECTLEGVAGIAESLNTSLLRLKLEAYLPKTNPAGRPIPAPQPRRASTAA